MPTPVVDATPAKLNLRLYRGDDRGVQLTFKDAAGPLALPETGWASEIRASIGTDVLASFNVDASQAAAGIIKLGISHTDSAVLPDDCVYDLQCDEGGSITTYLAGAIAMKGQVTLP